MTGVIDDRRSHALLLAEDPFDPEGTRGARHPLNVERDRLRSSFAHALPWSSPASSRAGYVATS